MSVSREVHFRVGDILRYDPGPTALMVVDSVYPDVGRLVGVCDHLRAEGER